MTKSSGNMKKITPVAAIFLLTAAMASIFAFTGVALALDPGEFRYSVELNEQIKKDSIYQVHLTPDIIERSAAGGTDLRVASHDTVEVPFVVLENNTPAEYVSNYYTLEYLPQPPEEETGSVTYAMKLPDKHQPVRIFEIDTPNNDFKKNIILYGSNDKSNWNFITEETIFDFLSQVNLRKTEIKLASAVDYLYYKIKIVDTASSGTTGGDSKSIKLKYEGLDFSVDNIKTQKLQINRVAAKTGVNVRKDHTVAYDEKLFSSLSPQKDKSNNTVIDIEANLPFDRISFDITTTYYQRKVSILSSETGAEKTYTNVVESSIYNFPMMDFKSSRNEIYFSTPKHRFYRFIIENKNNPALTINSIKYEWVRKDLYFVALSDSPKYLLCFGNPALKKPEYDIQNFIHQGNWYKQKYGVIKTGDVILNTAYAPSTKIEIKPEVEKMILTIIVIFLVLGLGYWLYNLISQMTPPPDTDDTNNSDEH